MKRLVLLAVIGVSTIGILAAFGFGPMRGHMMDPKKAEKYLTFRINDALDDLQATPTQRETVLAVKDRLLPEARQMFDGREAHREAVKALWLTENPDPKAVHSMVDQRIDEFRALAHKLADGALEIQRVLTPAQRAQLAEKAEQHHAEMGHGRHP